jgi:hypothetical protein
MSNLSLPPNLVQQLPLSVGVQLSQMPQVAQEEFFHLYTSQARSTSVSYILHLLVMGTHYAYLNKWISQLFYWLTAGGFGLWWLIDLARIPSMVQKYNNQVAETIMKDLLIKYETKSEAYLRKHAYAHPDRERNLKSTHPIISSKPSLPPLRPRPLKPMVKDALNPSLEHLQMDSLLDYDLKTWRVAQEWQYDWEDGESLREFRLVSETEAQSLTLYLKKEGGHVEIFVAQKINIHLLDEQLEEEILTKQKPRNILIYKGQNFYREPQRKGFCFDMSLPNPVTKLSAWEYFNESRDQILRLETYDQNQSYRALIGERVSVYEFSNILLKGIEDFE